MPPHVYCDENGSATMRGRAPAHDTHRCRKLLLDSLVLERRRQLLQRNVCDSKNNTLTKWSSIGIDARLFEALCYHHYSHDNISRPRAHCKSPPLAKSDFFDQMPAHDFCHVRGFWPDRFKKISEALLLTPMWWFTTKREHGAKKVLYLRCSGPGEM